MAFILEVHAPTASLMTQKAWSQAADLSTGTLMKSLISVKSLTFVTLPQDKICHNHTEKNLYSLKDERTLFLVSFYFYNNLKTSSVGTI